MCLLCSDSCSADTAELAERAGVSEKTADEAVRFWCEAGVISLAGQGNDSPAAEPAFSEMKPETKASPRAEKSIRYSPKELAAEIENNTELKYLTEEYEKLKGRPIRDQEILSFINITQYYEFSAPSVLLIMEYCKRLDKLSAAYIETLVKEWYSSGITDYKDVESKIISQSGLHSYEGKVRRAFALDGKLSKSQQQLVAKWHDMGYSIEMLEIAYDRCMDNKNKLSFPYIDAIINSWISKGIKTPKQAEKELEEFSTASKTKRSTAGDKSSSSYDIDEWEQFAKNFDLKKRN